MAGKENSEYKTRSKKITHFFVMEAHHMQRNRQKSLPAILAIILLIITPLIFAQATNKTAVDKVSSSTFLLSDVLGNDKIVLNGTQTSYMFYPPIPHNWQLKTIKLHVVLSYSAILSKESVLTLLVNDQPISSIGLLPEKHHELIWDVDVPAELISANKLPVMKINGFVRINDPSFCPNYDSTSTWVRINNNSTITYDYKQQNLVADLVSFPYPFIHDQALQPDRVTIVFPEQMSTTQFISALYLTNFLASHATWRGIKISATDFSRLTDEQKKQNNLIFIAAPDWLAKQTSLFANLPLTMGADGFFKNKDNQKIAENTGIIIMAESPWNPVNGALIITGNSSAAVSNAVANLQRPEFSQIAYGNYVLTENAPATAKTHAIDWKKVTFNNLGYTDEVVKGVGEHTLHYNIPLPNDKIPEWLNIIINLSHSSLTSAERSSLVLIINKVPRDLLKLAVANENNGSWNIVIPRKYLTPGVNSLDMIFDLHVPGEGNCQPTNQNNAWAVISDSSSISAHFIDNPPLVALSSFPVPFSGHTIIVLPEQLTAAEQNAAISLVTFLGSVLKADAQTLKVITEKHADPALLAGSNIIILGNLSNNSLIKNILSTAPLSYSDSVGLIREQHMQLIANKYYPLGMLELSISPWNKNKIMLVITGNQDFVLTKTIENLINENTRAKLVGNIAVIQPDNSVRSFNTWPTTKLIAEHFMGKGLIVVAASIILIVVLSIFVMIRFYRKQKQKNSN